MTLQDSRLLTDENMHPEVVQFLRSQGCDVLDVQEEGLHGTGDVKLMRLAYLEDRIILTHDRDFGRLAITTNEPMKGIIFLRPGHIDPRFTIGTLRVLFSRSTLPESPFIIVAERAHEEVKIRIRSL